MSDPQTQLGKLIEGDVQRDAIHIAVAPATAAHRLGPGEAVGFVGDDLELVGRDVIPIGIVDPFLPTSVRAGERFWLFLFPNTITSLKHVWTHPAFADAPPRESTTSASERWMRAWAAKHMSEDYYGDGEKLSAEAAYESAIEAGRSHSIGPHEEARDHIDDEWWSHWEAITGRRGDRDSFFSCAC